VHWQSVSRAAAEEFPNPRAAASVADLFFKDMLIIRLLTLLHRFAANGPLVIGIDGAVAAPQQIDVPLLDQVSGYIVLLEGHIAEILRSNGVRTAVPAL